MSVNQAEYAKRVRDYSEQVRLADEAASALKIQDVMAGTVAIKGLPPAGAPLRLHPGLRKHPAPLLRVHPGRLQARANRRATTSRILSVQGKVDFVFLVQMVISLIALLFASDMISGEKESGTLRAMLANSLPRDTILVGKIGGGFLALLGPVPSRLPPGRGRPPARRLSPLRRRHAGPVLIVLLATSLFILTYFTIGIAVSASDGQGPDLAGRHPHHLGGLPADHPQARRHDRPPHPSRPDGDRGLAPEIAPRPLHRHGDGQGARPPVRPHLRHRRRGARGRRRTRPRRKKWDPLRDDIQHAGPRAQEPSSSRPSTRPTSRRSAGSRTWPSTCRSSRRAPPSPGSSPTSAARASSSADQVPRGRPLPPEGPRQRALQQGQADAHDATTGGQTSMAFSATPVDAKKLPKFTITPASLAETLQGQRAEPRLARSSGSSPRSPSPTSGS